ncbi:MAG: hypothetical protein ACOCWQ_01395 [Nanoarchaeota archaeon]
MKHYITRKAQTATEYLIILAVVIIIALIVVGVMGGIPGIGGSSSGHAKSAYWSTAKVGIDTASLVAGSNDTLILRNNMPNSIKIKGLLFGETTTDRDNGPNYLTDDAYYGRSESGITLASGQTLSLDDANISNCTAGETVNFYLTIEYEDLETSATYNFSGLDASYEVTCAAS